MQYPTFYTSLYNSPMPSFNKKVVKYQTNLDKFHSFWPEILGSSAVIYAVDEVASGTTHLWQVCRTKSMFMFCATTRL